MRLVGRSVLAVMLAGLAALAACDSPRLSVAPSSVAPSGSSASESAAASAPAPSLASGTFDPNQAGPIFGPWRAEPVPVPPILVARADEACRANLGPEQDPGLAIVVVDARGESALPVYYASPDGASASCTDLVVDELGGISGERGHGVSAHQRDVLGPQDIEFTEFTWCCEARITASHLVGRAGAGVARVEIRSPGRRSIVASLANGWWAAWTPGPMPARWSIVALDSLGRVVDTIDGVPQVGP